MARPIAPLSETSGDPAILERNLARRIIAEVRWSFRWPCNWLAGVFLNLALSFLWLIFVPLTGGSHGDAVILVGTYFAVFILADVTTTNVLGLDAARVRASMAGGVSVSRLLLTKNYALLAIVGIPTLVATAALTVHSEHPYRLTLTLPGVALPMFAWLGVGNVVSAVFPVAIRSLRTRWIERFNWVTTVPWLAHLAVPYLLLYATDPVGDASRGLVRLLPRPWRVAEVRGATDAVVGLAIWFAGTWFAAWFVRRRGLKMY